MVAKNLPNIVGSISLSTLPPVLKKGSQGRTVGALPVIGAALTLLLGTSSLSHANDVGGMLGGIMGGIISQQMQMQRPAAPVYVTPAPVYVAPTTVYVAPSQPYYEPRRRAARPVVTKAVIPAEPVAAKLTNAEKNTIADLRGTLSQFGDDQDIIVLIAAHDTQHVVRDLSGTPQFVRPAQGCFPFKLMNSEQSTPEGRYLREIIERAEKKGNGKVRMTPCTAKNFGQFDLLVFFPDQMSPDKNPEIRPENIQPIVDAVNQGSFMQYGDAYSKKEFEADAQGRADVIAKDEAHRLRDKKDAERAFNDNRRHDADISAIFLKSPATDICVLGGPSDPLSDMLKKGEVREKFADLLPANAKVLPAADANRVFLLVKQHDCDAVIGTKEMLNKVIPALERDNVPFDYHPDSITLSEMKELALANPGEPTAPVRQ
jgi:hypothetical protein